MDSSKSGLLQHSKSEVDAIAANYVGIIRHKIENLLAFSHNNYINASNYEEYKQSSDFQKLLRIAKEYKDRYSNELKSYWESSKCAFATEPTLKLVAHLQKLLEIRSVQEDAIKKYEREIIIIDYLITSKQLIDILKNGENFEKFAKKSRIEEIVEGKTADISRDLLDKIMKRAKEIVQPPDNDPALYQRAAMIMV